MKDELLKLIEEKSPGAKPLYLVVRGSHAYGTNIETSDTDYAGVFIQAQDDILGNRYKEQINDSTNDIVIYEIRRFLELLESNNPTVLELLNTPEDCVIYKDPIFDLVLENREKFITKICARSLGGYAKQQISKAKGQNKKQNWEKDKVTRKMPLDFCNVILPNGRGSVSLLRWFRLWYIKNEAMLKLEWVNENPGSDLNDNDHLIELTKHCGVSNIPNSRDMYYLFYDNNTDPKLYRGIVNESSNEIRLSSIPKGKMPIAMFSYNKDGYTQHCKDFKSYQVWLDERNTARWVDVKSHGQQIDGKNMMHCVRLMGMAREIGEGKGIIVRRENAQDLIDIRKGKVDLQTLIDNVESEIVEIDKIFAESSLPNSVDKDFITNLLIKIRKSVYNK